MLQSWIDRATRIRPEIWRGYLLALTLPALTGVVKIGLADVLGPSSPFLLYPIAVLVSAWVGGFGPGLLATACSAAIANLHLPPVHSAFFDQFAVGQNLMFLAQSLLICAFATALHRVRDRLHRSNEDLRQELEERHQIEKDLRRSEERYAALVRASSQVVFISTPDAFSQEATRWLEAFTGIKYEPDAPESWWYKAIHPDDRAGFIQEREEVTKAPRHLEHTFRLCRHDGDYRYIRLRAVPIIRVDGSLREWVGTFADITRDKDTEQRLRESEEKALRRLQEIELYYETAPIGLCVLDNNLRFLRINRVLAEINGIPPEAHIGRTVREIVPELASQAEPLFHRVLETGEPVVNLEIRGRTASHPEERIWVESYHPIFNSERRVVGINVVALDVTDERNAEASLRTSEERFRVAQELSLDGFTILSAIRNAEGAIVDFQWEYANPEAIRLLKADKLVGNRLLDRLPGNQFRSELFERYVRVAETGEPHDIEIFYDSEGIRGWFRNMAVPLGDCIAVYFRDITDKKESELIMSRENEELERRVHERTRELEQRNRDLQSFAFVASHDLQEPLRKIQAFSSLLRLEADALLDENGHFYLGRMEEAAARMSRQLADVLAYSRVATQTGAFKKVSLEEILQDVLSELEQAITETRAEIVVDAAVSIEADSVQLRQLLLHITRNALKFQREGVPPHLQITARIIPPEPATTSLSWTNLLDRCRIVVEDNGIGFDQKYAERIFEPFQRLHGQGEFSGTGMGLAVCRRIAERHGGTIRAESTPGTGSRFIIELPTFQQVQESIPSSDMSLPD